MALVNVTDYVDDEPEDEDVRSKLQLALDAAQGGVLLFPDARVYLIDVDAEPLRIRAHTRIVGAGAVLRIRRTSATGDAAVHAGPGLCADRLRIEANPGSVLHRALELASDTRVDRVEVASDAQQDNLRRGHAANAAVLVRGERIDLGHVSVRGFHKALLVRDSSRVTIGHVDVRHFTTGVYFLDSHFVTLASGTVRDGYEPAVPDLDAHDGDENVQGMNGLLVANCTDVSVSDLIVQRSIEHGVRVGGVGKTRQCTFSNVQVQKPGWSGMKIHPANGGSAERVRVDGLLVSDCSPSTAARTVEERMAIDSRNRCGLRLENCNDVVVDGFQLLRAENERASAFHGLYVSRARNVTVNGPQISDALNSGIRLSDGSDNEKGGSGPVNEVYLRDPSVTYLTAKGPGPGVDAIWIESEHPLRNVVVSGCYLRGQTGYGVWIGLPKPPDGQKERPALDVRWPVVLQGWVSAERDDLVLSAPPDADIHDHIVRV